MGCFFRVLTFLLLFLGGVVCELGRIRDISQEMHLPDLINKGKALRAEGRFKEAIGTFSQALVAAKNQDLKTYKRDCLLELGILFWNIGIREEAEYCLQEAALDFEHVADILAAMSLFWDGVKYQENRDFINAEETLRIGLFLSEKIQAPEIEVRLHRHLGEVLYGMGDLNAFFLHNETAIRLSRALRHRCEEGKSLKNIGTFCLKTGRQETALMHFEKALEIFIEIENHEETAECLKKIGNLYADWGDFDKGFSFLFQALDQKTGCLRPQVLAEHLLNIGLTYRKKWIHHRNVHDLFQALSYSRRALETEGLRRHQRISRSVLISIGVILCDIGQHEEALSHFQKAEEMSSDLRFDEEFVDLIKNQGRALKGMGHVDAAVRHFNLALELAESHGMEHLIWESHLELGECFRENKHPERSLEHYRRAIEILEKIRSGISTDFFKTGFSRDKMQAYRGVVDLLYEKMILNPTSECLSDLFHAAEKAKARVFLEKLVDNRMAVNASSPIKESLKDHLLRRDEEAMRYPVSLSRIQSELLDERTALIKYFLGDQRSLAFIVTRYSCTVYSLPPRRTIEKNLRGYLKLMAQLPEGPSINHRASERIAEELQLHVIKQDDLENIDVLIIVPDGLLHVLPFETLRIKTLNRSEYLVNKFQISYVPSASALFFLNQSEFSSSKTAKKILAFGNPKYGRGDFKSLPYSRKEIGSILKVFPSRQIDVFQGKKANKSLLMSLDLSSYQILHFACHGYVDEKFPLRSALVLSPAGKEDNGILQVREIYGMRMNADLVVLSACQSGGGRIENSEGIVGLPRVFISAGSRSVIASLWPIRDDAAAVFMQHFYVGLSRGKTKSQALRSAKLKMLSTRYSHPHYWAAFVLHGDFASSVWNPAH